MGSEQREGLESSHHRYLFDGRCLREMDHAEACPGHSWPLGAVAVSVGDQIFLLGGYVMDAQGGENTLPDVNVYDPLRKNGFVERTFLTR